MDNRVGERLRQAATQMVKAHDDPVERLKRRRDRKRRNERVLAGVVSMVLVGALVGGTFIVLGERHQGSTIILPGGPTGQNGLTGQNGGGALEPGQYLYMRQTLVKGNDRFSTETWWAPDGSGRQRVTCPTKDCVTYQNGQFIDSYGSESDDTYGPGDFPSDDDLTGLSTDPTTLRQQLIDRTGPNGLSPEPPFSPGPEIGPSVTVGAVLEAILNIAEEPNALPDLKWAVFQVAVGLPGVDVRTGTTDGAGRPASALDISLDGGPAASYSIDPTTSLLMGWGSSNDEGGFVVYDQGIVDSTDVTPTGDQWLFPPAP
jgi:hypothetical protein